MINSVRNTVLSVLNKNNYGYISPSDFNLFAKQAQLDIFEDYFYDYNYQVNKENARTSGTGYADIKKELEEVIDSLSVEVFLAQSVANTYSLPANYYLINKLYYFSVLLASGTTTGAPVAFQLIDGGASFNSTVSIGDIVVNVLTAQEAYVVGVTNTILTLSADIFTLVFQSYAIYSPTAIREVERVHQNRIFNLTNSNLTAPTTTYPAYVLGGNIVTVYPTTIRGISDIKSQYIRYPLDPKWTFSSLPNGEPLFDITALDYQDFELPDSDEPNLINKILQYAGVSIRELEVYKVAAQEELENTQEEQ